MSWARPIIQHPFANTPVPKKSAELKLYEDETRRLQEVMECLGGFGFYVKHREVEAPGQEGATPIGWYIASGYRWLGRGVSRRESHQTAFSHARRDMTQKVVDKGLGDAELRLWLMAAKMPVYLSEGDTHIVDLISLIEGAWRLWDVMEWRPTDVYPYRTLPLLQEELMRCRERGYDTCFHHYWADVVTFLSAMYRIRPPAGVPDFALELIRKYRSSERRT